MDFTELKQTDQYKIRLAQFESFMLHYMEQYKDTTNLLEWDYLTAIDLLVQACYTNSKAIIWKGSTTKHKINTFHLEHIIGKLKTALERLETLENNIFNRD